MFDEALDDPATFDAMVAAMMRGDMATVIAMLAGDEAVADMQDARQELRDDLARAELPPEERALLEATEALLGAVVTPGDAGAVALMEQSLDTVQSILELQEAALGADAAAWRARLEELSRPDVPAPGRYSGLVALAGDLPLLEWRALDLERLESFAAEIAEDVERRREELAEPPDADPAWALPPEDDDASELMLDPLQAVLVSVDLLVAPRLQRTAGPLPSRPDPISPAGEVLAQSSSTAGNCFGIGSLQAAHPDAFGTLENMLAATRATRDAIAEAAFLGQFLQETMKRLARAAIDWSTVRLDVRVEYRPNDAGGAGGGIFRPHDRNEQFDRRVVFHIQLVDTLADLLPPRMRQLMETHGPRLQVCGFVKDIARDLGGESLADALDAIERMAEGRDFEGVPVHVDLGGEGHQSLTAIKEHWDGQFGASVRTMVARMNADGYGSGQLVPALVSPDVGGLATLVSVPVRFQAILTESPEMVRASRLAVRVVEDVARPVERWVRVNVAHYEPLPIRGSLGLERTVSERGFVFAFVDDVSTSVEREGDFTLEMQVEDVSVVGGAGPAAPVLPLPVLGPGGVPGGAFLTATVTYTLRSTTIEEWTGDCDGAPTPFSRMTVRDVAFRGRGSLPAPQPVLAVDSRRERYALHPGTTMTAVPMAIAAGGWSGTEQVDITTVGCAGPITTSDSRQVDLTEDALGVLLAPTQVPRYEWRPFDRGARTLDERLAWSTAIPRSGQMARLDRLGETMPDVTFEVTTTVNWNLTRGD
jgi:hypothetical protein